MRRDPRLADTFIRLSLRLGGMLKQAGFTVEDVQSGQGPIGHLCRVRKGINDRSLSEFTDFSIEGLEFLITRFAAIMRREGTLEAPLGHPVSDDQELQSILAEVRHGLQTGGAICVGACFLARKM
jgi:hypothetical protein